MATAAEAGDEGRSGSAGATELRIPIGARANAVGGAVVGSIEGAAATFWNPAGIAHIDGRDFGYSYTNYFADMDLNWLGFGVETGFGHLGFSAKILSIGDLIVTTEQAPNGTGEIISPNLGTFGVTFARALTDRVLVGTTLNIVHENFLQVSATGVAFDFGFQYLLPGQGLSFGLAIKNIGPRMSFAGGDLESTFIPSEGDPGGRPRTFSSISSTFELPSHLVMGVAYKVFDSSASSLLLSGDFQSNAFSGDEFRGGAEYAFWAGQGRGTGLFVRGGWNQADQDEFLMSGGALGFGVDFKTGDTRTKIDYSLNFINSDFRDLFDDQQTVTLNYSF